MSIGISMVMFSDQPSLSANDIASLVAGMWSDGPRVSGQKDDGIVSSFQIGAADVIIALMPAPISWSDLEGPCATSLLWPGAESVVRAHKTHAIVTVSGELEPLELSKLLTKASAALMKSAPSASGIYWGNSSSVVRKDVFIDLAVEVMPEAPPLHIWLQTRVGSVEGGKTSGFTTGMQALGYAEFEAVSVREAVSDLRERFYSLAYYLLDHGPVIKDGDTVGQDQDEKIRVKLVESSFGQKGKVMRLVYEQTVH